MPDDKPTRKTVAATERTLEIVDALKQKKGARVSELSKELGITKSSVHSHLATLEQQKYVVKEGDKYLLSLQFLDIAEHVRNRDPVFRVAKSKVKEIAEETEEVASLMAEDHGRGIFVYRRKGDNTTRPATVGNRVHLHATAGGKAILAHLTTESVEEIIEQWGLPPVTDNTITDRQELMDELDSVRERGVAFNDEEDIDGLRAVAVPVMNANNRIAGSLSVYGPAHRMRDDLFREEIPDLLLESANDIQLNVAFTERRDLG